MFFSALFIPSLKERTSFPSPFISSEIFFLPPKNSGTIKAMSSTSYVPIPPINNNLVIAILILGLHPPTHGCSYHLRGSTVCRCASGFRDRRSSDTLFSIELPSDVAKGITVLPLRSWLSMNVFTMVGARDGIADEYTS